MPYGFTSPLAGTVDATFVTVVKWDKNGEDWNAPAEPLAATVAKPAAAASATATRSATPGTFLFGLHRCLLFVDRSEGNSARGCPSIATSLTWFR
jgi:hypothetical protein